MSDAAAAVTDVAGRRLRERYKLERVAGEGALGRTYRARDLETGARVAIKELLPGRLKSWRDFDLFRREAEVLQSLQHAGIPRYLDHFEVATPQTPPRYYLVQQFIEGATLEAELEARGQPPEPEVRAVAAAVLEILVYLHGLTPPVIHRDIKPGNSMRDPDGGLHLIGFGAVREVLDTRSSEGSTMVGTFG